MENLLKEDESQELNRSYITLFNSVADYLFILDQKGIILYAQYRGNWQAGLYLARVNRKWKCLRSIHPDQREGAIRQFKLMVAGEQEHCLIPLYTKDGNLLPVESRVVPELWQGQKVFFYISKNSSNLTQANMCFSKAFSSNPNPGSISKLDKNKQQPIYTNKDFINISEYENELQEQRDFQDSLIDAVPDLVFYTIVNGLFLGCNAAFCPGLYWIRQR